MYTRFAIELAIVLTGGGHVFNKIPVKTGIPKPPKKNYPQSNAADIGKLSTNAIGNPHNPAQNITKTATGYAEGLL